jgi:type IV pilus assembly protein PilV
MNTLPAESSTTLLARQASGFTIIEVAVAMLILSVGLLGVAGLQATGMQSAYQSHQRAVAMTQARDLADRMRSNTAGVRAAEYIKTIPTAKPSPDCESAASTCSAAQLAASDLYNWASMTGELLPSGQGAVACNDLDASTAGVLESGSDCLITVRWDGDRSGATGLGCGAGDLSCLRLRVIP